MLHGNEAQGRSSGSILPDDIALIMIINIIEDNLLKLSTNKLLLIKRYTTEGIFNIFVKDKFQTNLMELIAALLKEMHG